MNRATVTPDRDVFGIIALVDGEPTRIRECIDLAAERTEQVMSSLPGFRMVSVHVNADGSRMAEYIQWASEADFQQFIENDDLSWHVRRIGELTDAQTFSSYQTRSICSADGRDLIDISLDDAYCTRMGVFTCDSDRQRWVGDYLTSETERVARHLPGFVAAGIFVSHDGAKVGEYMQWETTADFESACSNEEFRQHIPVIDSHATPDVGSYQLTWVFSRDER